MSTTYTSTKITRRTIMPDDNLITIPVGKLYEFYCNLVMAGFSEHEAIQVTSKVASNAIRAN
jgi:hypothetical protein